ncbi:MAG: amino acid adenylation domain-containing protein [Dokdonella sp.]
MATVIELLRALVNQRIRLAVEAGQLSCYVHKGALTAELKAAIAQHKSELVALLQARQQADAPAPAPWNDADGTQVFALSVGARALYLLQRLDPASSAYNIPLCLRFNGAVDVSVLQRAWASVLDHYPILTTHVIDEDGVAHLRSDARSRSDVQCSEVAPADEAQLLPFLRRQACVPFELQCGPLIRIALFRQDEQRSALLITVHHLIFDGSSAVVLLKTLLANYRRLLDGRTLASVAASSGYRNFVAAETALLASPEGAKHAAYWQRQLGAIPSAFELVPKLPLPTDTASHQGSTLTETLPEDLSIWLRRAAREHRATPSAILLSAYAVLLHRYSGEEHLVVGMPVSARAKHRFDSDIGYFVNMVPLRVRCAGPRRFVDFLHETQSMMMEALYHSEYPFALMREGQRNRAAGENAIFQVSYAFQDFLHPSEFARAATEPGPDIEYLGSIVQEGDSDLALEVFDAGVSLVLQLKYAAHRYTRDTAVRLLAHYCRLLQAIRADPTGEISTFSILSDDEEHRFLQDFNATHADYPKQSCIHDLFVQQALAQPQRAAVVYGSETLTYGELEAISRDLAAYLQANGVRAGVTVGLCLGRWPPLLIGLLGILRAGGTVVPLDPDYPPERLAYMLHDSGAAMVLTQRIFEDRLQSAVSVAVRTLCWDDQESSITQKIAEFKAGGAELRREAGPGDPAYLIYTSGSTGQPKGVLVEHHSLVNHNVFARAQYRIDADDTQILFSSMSFDLFLEEVFCILNSGAKLVLAPKENLLSLERLQTLIVAQRVSVLNLPTAFFHELVGAATDLAGIRCVVVGGEKLDYAKALSFVEKYPGTALHNTYGPTETTIISTAVEVTLALLHGRDTVPIGRPIANTQIYLLDRYGNLQPPGVAGELCIAGDGVSRGYWGKPALTRERFVANPFISGTRLYLSGDLARWLEDGTLEYLGRVDGQVKIRGFRIEPGEIEARLHAQAQIESAVVVARGEAANRQLVAFYRARDGAQPSADELRAHLKQTLPAYMIPAGFVQLATIPLTPTGKVDRRALERLDVTLESNRPYVSARTPTEQQLVDIWAQVLKLSTASIGMYDNFFELGGHSLLATQLLARIRDRFGVDLPLKNLFDGADIATISVWLLAAERRPEHAIKRADRLAWPRLPLSYAQERLWFIHQLNPDGSGYNVPGALRISGTLDIEPLQRAFALIIGRHENLRTVFTSEQGQPCQRVLDVRDFRLGQIDLSAHEVDSRESLARSLCEAEAAVPFNLGRGPLIRGQVIRLAADDHVLMLALHHIVSDGWSIGVLVNELGEVLQAMQEGRAPAWAPLPIQYVDYAIWQREWLQQSGVLQRQLSYWCDQLAGVPDLLDLATDYPRPVVQSSAGASQKFVIDAALTASLRHLAAQQNCTLFMLLLAVVKTLLYRYTAQEDICIGTPIANRRQAETEGLIGMFVNTLVLRTPLRAEASFADVVAAVKRTCVAAYEHQDAPFEKVVETVRPQRSRAISPLFQVMVALQNADGEIAAQNLRVFPLNGSTSKFDLTVEFCETADDLGVVLEYCTALYRPERIARMAAHLRALCHAVVVAPHTAIARLDYLSEEERRELLRVGSAVSPDAGDTDAPTLFAHQWFEVQAAARPQAIALEYECAEVCFAELNERANRIAHALLARGVAADDRIAICVDRGVAMVAGVLGTLKAGAAYVPLDPDYPPARLAYLLQDSAPRALLTEVALQDSDVVRQAVAQGVDVLLLDGRDIEGQPIHDPTIAVEPHHLAYVIYTSGSTGQPKGVMIEHAGLLNYLRWAVRTYASDAPCDAVVSSPLAFDATVTSLYLPLLTGGRAVLLRAGDELIGLESLLRSGRRFDLLKITPLHWRELGQRLAADGVRCEVGRFVVGGEALPYSSAQAWRTVAPHARCINEYGPTETVVGCSVHELQHGECGDGDVPIGLPIDDTRIYILDAQGGLQPLGVPGELYIAGAGLARGYLNRPELTEQRFVADPFVPGARIYRSGDLARWREDGRLEYLGRADEQVKIRGFRIELGEIEAKLDQHAQIETSVVITRGEQANKQLIAYYRACSSTEAYCVDIPANSLRAHLQETLPPYMIPSAFVSLTTIAKTPSGKVDRRALERLAPVVAASERYAAPRTAIEKQLVDIWAEVLQLAPSAIGTDDNFFDIGGHSLLAVRLMAKTTRHFGRLLPLAALFTAPTISTFAEFLADHAASAAGILVPIQSGGGWAPLFAVPGAGGNVLSMHPLSRALGAQQPFYGLQSVGLDGIAPPLQSVEDTAMANIAAMRKVQANGPYRMLGHSYGGIVAFEMARQLMEQGEEVASLTLLDSFAPAPDARPPDAAAELAELLIGLAASSGVSLRANTQSLRKLSNAEAADLLTAHGLDIGREQFELLYEVFKANRRCYARYRPDRLVHDIDVYLYRAEQRSDGELPASDYGWSELLTQPPKMIDIDADHFSLLDGIAVQRLADELRRTGAVQRNTTPETHEYADVRLQRALETTATATMADHRSMT